MTRDEWEAEWKACFSRLRAKGYDLVKAQTVAREITRARYGPQPPKPPLWLRVGASVAGRIVGGSSMWQRIVVAVVYGIGASGPVLAAALADGLISGNEWSAILSALLVAFWGKFSSSTTIISATRQGETQSDKPGVSL